MFVKETQFVESSPCSRLTVARKRKVEPVQVAYKNEARGVKSLKIQILGRCNEGTIVDGPVKNPNRTALKTNSQLKFPQIQC